MIHPSLIHTFINDTEVQQTKAVSINQGDIFQGKVTKLFPNDIAAVQIGGMKLLASFEVPLSVGVDYWFQATNHEGQLNLKVIGNAASTKNQMNESSMITQLLSQFQLDDSKANIALLRFLMKENMPFTKGEINHASNWFLQSTDREGTLQTIKTMLVNDLPFTDEVYHSISSTYGKEPLSKQLYQIQELLGAQQFQSAENKLLQAKIASIISINSQSQETTLSKLLQTLVDDNAHIADKQTLLSILDKLTVQTNKSNNTIQVDIDSSKELGNRSNLLPSVEKVVAQLHTILTAEGITDKDKSIIGTISSRLGSNMDVSGIGNKLNEIVEQITKGKDDLIGFSSKEKQLLFQLGQSIQNNDGWENGTAVKMAFQQISNSMGLDYESLLKDFTKTPHEIERLESIKPLLLTILQQSISKQLNESIEAVLYRLNAQQLLSQEQGPFQHIMMQLPVPLYDRLTDVSIQWSGKKQQSGEIDPNFCRVIFFVELESIKETVIDVHIQNRIINISIINDTEGLANLIKSMQNVLKENLLSLDYQLSSVKVLQSAEGKQNVSITKSIAEKKHVDNNYYGVDIRI
ncbi:hypothetical protein V1503_18145 [Bacillus sp. SCS-151]|uniref:hypothetical protein n=1 Tax=Nanhaiella sioensis TaxID=3115293 RepID=UPI00397B3EA2